MTQSDPTKRSDLGKPADPTTDPQSFLGDTYGLTGITTNDSNTMRTTDDDEDGVIPSLNDATVQEKLYESPSVDENEDDRLFDLIDDGSNETLHAATAPSVAGEQLVSGDMTDPESDDDTLLNSHQVGLRLDEDYDNPKELNIAADVAAAEAARRSPDDDDDRDYEDE